MASSSSNHVVICRLLRHVLATTHLEVNAIANELVTATADYEKVYDTGLSSS